MFFCCTAKTCAGTIWVQLSESPTFWMWCHTMTLPSCQNRKDLIQEVVRRSTFDYMKSRESQFDDHFLKKRARASCWWTQDYWGSKVNTGNGVTGRSNSEKKSFGYWEEDLWKEFLEKFTQAFDGQEKTRFHNVAYPFWSNLNLRLFFEFYWCLLLLIIMCSPVIIEESYLLLQWTNNCVTVKSWRAQRAVL
jgi:hypothetical protein